MLPFLRMSSSGAHKWTLSDVTAREEQSDQGLFLMGKSPDTFCDVIATGIPDGVGVHFHPPKFLKPGDLVEVSVTGLRKLRNRVSDTRPNALATQPRSRLPIYSLERTWGAAGLTRVGDKMINVREIGSRPGNTIVFIHGLGASLEYCILLILEAGLEARYRIILCDLEGHGLIMPVLLVAGQDDKISSTTLAESYAKRLPDATLEVLEGVGHWHVTEDIAAVTRVLRGFL
ncbi:uncharacterized protein Z519_11477 [Cladophialophora bantiana CBS 173.52]|uniref:Fumarylacetoacetase-like C-terminal domain-containing protein n=1 Tax=Cladophialophora bantiana (strain ATCC 10958 / CBS 173.52 / CDC B-1940 / NIH 8579) TaxID=1442370 RepID=A0A0D2H3K7_CLAB1|nr:uncharacterized protein Z519_11477 [Cladophialophora bantiana CBS 173.52]KIW87893.1 hypothetical protein Z519_11477 [Cladophialophora bantiana CBS 173.52]